MSRHVDEEFLDNYLNSTDDDYYYDDYTNSSSTDDAYDDTTSLSGGEPTVTKALLTTEGISAYFVLFSTLLAFVLVLSKFHHERPKLASIFPEAGMILAVGMVAGFFVNFLLLVDMDVTNDMHSSSSSSSNNNNSMYHTGGEGGSTNSNNDDPNNIDAITTTTTTEEDGVNISDESVVDSLLQFSPEVFFVALLPPIIFNSGYHLRRELFFRHFAPICLFAVAGTLISALTIAFTLEFAKGMGYTGGFTPYFTELLTFGALISATDPVSTLAVFQAKCVDPHLFYLVFGESVLNDAVGLVLFNAFSKFVIQDNGAGEVVIGVSEFIIGFLFDSVGSPILGLLCGCGTALLFKHADMRSSPTLELSVYILIMYVPFLLAEAIELSGIVTILFSGMTARAYVVPNLSEETAQTAEVLFRLFAHMAETSIFLELGLSVFGLAPGSFEGKFIVWSLLACLIGRALNIYPLSFLYNLHLKTQPADPEELKQYHPPQHEELESQNRGANNIIINNNHIHDHHNHHHNYDHHDIELQHNSSSSNSSSNSSHGDGIMKIQSSEGLSSRVSIATITPIIRRDLKIQPKTQHMLCFSGLRGAVAYACVRSFPDKYNNQREFVVATMVIVLVTVFLFGGTTEIVLNHLDIEMDIDEEKYMIDWHRQRRPTRWILILEDYIYRNVVRDDYSSAEYSYAGRIDHCSTRGDDDDDDDHQDDVHDHNVEELSSCDDDDDDDEEEESENKNPHSDEKKEQDKKPRASKSKTLLSAAAAVAEDAIDQFKSDIELTEIVGRFQPLEDPPKKTVSAASGTSIGATASSSSSIIAQPSDKKRGGSVYDTGRKYVAPTPNNRKKSPTKRKSSLFDFGGH